MTILPVDFDTGSLGLVDPDLDGGHGFERKLFLHGNLIGLIGADDSDSFVTHVRCFLLLSYCETAAA